MMASRLLVRSFRNVQKHLHQVNASQFRQASNAAALNINLPKTDVTTLNNGFRVASENWNTPTCTVGVWVDVGSRYETDANNGVAHFLEHMAFKGTEKRSQQDIEIEVENKGAQLNAYTSREITVYYAKCFSKDVPWAVELLADILKNSKFDKQQIDRERGVILREMQEIETNYHEVIFDYLHATAYQGTPLGRTILGPVENVKSLQQNDLKLFIDSYYKGPRMVLTAAGGIPHTQLTDLAQQHFGDLSATYTGDVPSIKPCRYTGSEIRDRDDALPLAHVALAVEGPGWASADTIPLMIASTLHGTWDRSHGGGANVASKLAASFFADGGVHSFHNFFTCYQDTSLWGIYYTAEPAVVDAPTSYMITSEWRRMCVGVTDFEIERAKNQLKTNLLLQVDGTTPICEDIGRHMLTYGRRVPVHEMMARIEVKRVIVTPGQAFSSSTVNPLLQMVTAADVRETCMKYIYDKCPVMASLGPVEAMPDYNMLRKRMFSRIY